VYFWRYFFKLEHLPIFRIFEVFAVFFHQICVERDKDKSPEVPFHIITSSYSYFEEFEFLRQFSKKQNMIKKKYPLNRGSWGARFVFVSKKTVVARK
jgi:hypothetical protein